MPRKYILRFYDDKNWIIAEYCYDDSGAIKEIVEGYEDIAHSYSVHILSEELSSTY